MSEYSKSFISFKAAATDQKMNWKANETKCATNTDESSDDKNFDPQLLGDLESERRDRPMKYESGN